MPNPPSESRLPIDLEEILPLAALRRIGEIGLVGFLAEYVQEQVENEPALQRDPDFLADSLPFLEYVLRYFDAEVEGLEQLPKEGPMLLVGNHSGGTLVPASRSSSPPGTAHAGSSARSTRSPSTRSSACPASGPRRAARA